MTDGPVSAQFAAVEESLISLQAFVERVARQFGVEQTVVLKASLVIEELFVNTITHGGSGVAQVEVAICRREDALELFYADDARAFDPFSTPVSERARLSVDERPVGGLGVLLVQGLCSHRRYQRASGRNLTQLKIDLRQ